MQPYNKLIETVQRTPQSEPLADRGQVPNSAGGYVWSVDDQQQLDRFLILGSSSGTYYIGAKELTKLNVDAIKRLVKVNGLAVVARIVEISGAGRAVSNDPALAALAVAAAHGDVATRHAALVALPEVARIPTHLFHFMAFLAPKGRWNRSLRTAIKAWYHGKSDLDLAYAMTKYQARDGWSHADTILLAHVKPVTEAQRALFEYARPKVAKEVA